MPRGLSLAFDAIVLGPVQMPLFKIEVWDLRSTRDEASPSTINDVVIGNPMPAIVGPRDFTADVDVVNYEGNAGDYTQNGVVASAASFTVQTLVGDLEPVTGTNGRWLRQGNAVRVTYGDEQVPEADWVPLFTGTIHGQPGLRQGAVSGTSVVSVTAVSREAPFMKLEETSSAFNENTSIFDMAESVVQNEMGLATSEYSFPPFGAVTTGVETTQLVDVSPLVMLAQLGFQDGLMPRFDGEGVLILTNGITTKPPARVYTVEDAMVQEITRPPVELNAANTVTVLGLDPNLSEVVMPRQVLNDINISLGFYTPKKKIEVWFSEDHTQMARDTALHVIASVDSGIIKLGGQSWTEYTDPTSGIALSGQLTVKSAYMPVILAMTAVTLVLSCVLPDISLPFGGATIPIGKIALSIILVIVQTITQTHGAGVFEITGKPVEFVHAEVKGTARKKGTRVAEEDSLTVSNHLLQTQPVCKTVAERILIREQQLQNDRAITAVYDPALVPDDVFEHSDGTRYLIQRIRLQLGPKADGRVALDCFEVTPGVIP
jgi:hypothetical protein